MNRTILIKKIKHQRSILLPRLVKAGLCLNYLLTSVIHFSERKRQRCSTTISEGLSGEDKGQLVPIVWTQLFNTHHPYSSYSYASK